MSETMNEMDDLLDEERDAQALDQRMREGGVPGGNLEPHQQSYFGFEEKEQVLFPDGVTYVEITALNEGARRRYLNKVNRDILLQKSTGNAIMRMQQGDEKHILLEAAITDWNLIGLQGQPMVFNQGALQKWLAVAPPKVVDLIEKAVRKQNPWLLSEMSVEDINQQIKELEEMRDVKIKEEEGKSS